mmetsp:Transcript_34036/g.73623  ORF Transcript_34036/g.73623 Transcript_34036/m.73623 type:complete len:226 (+) Transcript_34036:67-744(+)
MWSQSYMCQGPRLRRLLEPMAGRAVRGSRGSRQVSWEYWLQELLCEPERAKEVHLVPCYGRGSEPRRRRVIVAWRNLARPMCRTAMNLRRSPPVARRRRAPGRAARRTRRTCDRGSSAPLGLGRSMTVGPQKARCSERRTDKAVWRAREPLKLQRRGKLQLRWRSGWRIIPQNGPSSTQVWLRLRSCRPVSGAAVRRSKPLTGMPTELGILGTSSSNSWCTPSLS